jgi:hypothetical protein
MNKQTNEQLLPDSNTVDRVGCQVIYGAREESIVPHPLSLEFPLLWAFSGTK